MIKAFRPKSFVVIAAFLLASCGPAATATAVTTAAPAPTSAPAPTQASATEAPVAPTATMEAGMPSAEDQLAEIDAILRQSISASIAYNKPQSMKLGDTTTVELLLNPSLSPEALSTQVTASGQVASASIQITPRMKANLFSNDVQAFTIQPEQDSPEQPVSGTETTRWAWLVTAHKSGTQRLTLILYRLVQFEGQNYWREIETYQADIDVKVTVAQRLGSLDWKWIAGILIPAVLIPAFWRWLDQRRKKLRLHSRKKGA